MRWIPRKSGNLGATVHIQHVIWSSDLVEAVHRHPSPKPTRRQILQAVRQELWSKGSACKWNPEGEQDDMEEEEENGQLLMDEAAQHVAHLWPQLREDLIKWGYLTS